MVAQSELKHAITVSRSSWFVRLYLRVWQASEKDINFCKMFWGYVFMPVAFLLIALWFVTTPIRHYADRSAEKRVKRYRTISIPEAEARADKLEKLIGLAERVIGVVRRVVDLCRPAGRLFVRAIESRAVLYLVVAAAGAVGLGAVGFAVYLIVNNLHLAWIMAASVVGFVAAIGVAVGIGVWLDDSGTGLKFGGLVVGGLKSVKTNTCPRIEVKP